MRVDDAGIINIVQIIFLFLFSIFFRKFVIVMIEKKKSKGVVLARNEMQ